MFSPSNISGTTAMGGASGVAPSAPGLKPARRSLRDALRYAADLAVAFATLADVDPDAPSPRPPVDGTEIARQGGGDIEVSAEDAGSVACASTRATEDDGRRLVTPPHPHRVPLRASARGGRPGAVAARPQSCLTPVDGRHALGAPRAPKRRSRL